MTTEETASDTTYRHGMGQLLVLYTQVDRLIMEACAERIASAPDEAAKLALAKQVGDESSHVSIQHEWMARFGTLQTPVISAAQEEAILAHFRQLDWLEFLTDMYLCVEALGSDAVEKVVPLADPGTRESLRIPLQDELDHIAFGISRLKHELAQLPPGDRAAFPAHASQRIDALKLMLHGMGLNLEQLFESVGADYGALCRSVRERKEQVLGIVAEPLTA
jgi:hypothetical protein